MSFVEYCKDVMRHWVALMTSSLPVAILVLLQWIGRYEPPSWLYVAAVSIICLVAPFLAWKEKRDALNVFLDRKAVADFIGQILVETNHWWDTGCQVTPDEASAAKWCGDYDHWMVGLKARVSRRLGMTEEVSIFQIGPGLLDVKQTVGVTIEQQHRMACLKLHMEELKKALKRNLPGSASD